MTPKLHRHLQLAASDEVPAVLVTEGDGDVLGTAFKWWSRETVHPVLAVPGGIRAAQMHDRRRILGHALQ